MVVTENLEIVRIRRNFNIFRKQIQQISDVNKKQKRTGYSTLEYPRGVMKMVVREKVANLDLRYSTGQK
uniref:Uncharacterized protein n=1 Tax=Caenorhabditis japonica TaxID=281687 RepID=A0A8R1ILN5_CAEJA